jgi:hypothetical protein
MAGADVVGPAEPAPAQLGHDGDREGPEEGAREGVGSARAPNYPFPGETIGAGGFEKYAQNARDSAKSAAMQLVA